MLGSVWLLLHPPPPQFPSPPFPWHSYLPILADPTAQALAIALAVLAGAANEPAWRSHQEATVASPDAVVLALTGLPLPPRSDHRHTANMLRMLVRQPTVDRPTQLPAATVARARSAPLAVLCRAASSESASRDPPKLRPPLT